MSHDLTVPSAEQEYKAAGRVLWTDKPKTALP
jgi:hypothetical protein